MTRIFFSAGETSGDIHGANVIRALKNIDPAIACEGLGGTHMAEAGMALQFDLAGRAIMGLTEVLRSLNMIRRLFSQTLAHLARTRPDCLVVIDYPGFNMRLADKARALGIPVVYYISPQVWAWKRNRLYKLAKLVRKMLVILPFEERLYKDIGVDCTYVGHPLLDHIDATPPGETYRRLPGQGHVIGLLPGSREQEIRRLMPVMIEVAHGIRRQYPDARFVTPCVNAQRETQVRRLAGEFPLETVVGKTYEILSAARFCLVASGTATLETALFGVPFVILYKVSALTHAVARTVVKIPNIGLVNILAERRVVPEFIQHNACVENILPVSLEIIEDSPARQRMLDDLKDVRKTLGDGGASRRVAAEILEVAQGATYG